MHYRPSMQVVLLRRQCYGMGRTSSHRIGRPFKLVFVDSVLARIRPWKSLVADRTSVASLKLHVIV